MESASALAALRNAVREVGRVTSAQVAGEPLERDLPIPGKVLDTLGIQASD